MAFENEMIVEVNGRVWLGAISINVERSLQNLASTFNFTTITSGIGFPFYNGDTCRIYVNQQQVIDGYIEKMQVVHDANEHFIMASGRDKTADIVDSTLAGTGLNFVAPITLPNITIKTFEIMNITGIDIITQTDIRQFEKDDIITPMVGETIFSFLSRYAKKRQVLATTDGYGNIVYTRSSNDILNTELIYGDDQSNILRAFAEWDNTQRFNKYIVHTQSSASAASKTAIVIPSGKSTHISGTATDDEIRQSRQYNFIAATPLIKPNQSNTNKQAIVINARKDDSKQRVIWESNVRKAASFNYSVNVQGYSATRDGIIWQPNKLVKVFDADANIDSTLLIQTVQYSKSNDEGSKTYMTLVTKDAFDLLEIQGNRKVKRASEKIEGKQFAGRT